MQKTQHTLFPHPISCYPVTSYMYHRQQNKCYPPKMSTCPFQGYTRIYLPIITKVKFVTVVKFHYRVLQVTAVFLII